VKIEDLSRAITCLRSFCDVEMEDGSPLSPTRVEDMERLNFVDQQLEVDPSEDVTLVRQHTLSVPDDVELYLVQIDKSCVRRHMFELVRLLFGQSSPCSQHHDANANGGKLFLSYSESGEDISVVTSDLAFVELIRNLAYRGEPGVMVSPDCWKVVQIGDKNLGFAETGIVAGHTRVLLNAGTMVFYLSTYATDFMLIKEDEWDDALQVLDNNFRLVRGGFVPLTLGDSSDVSTL
jgi:cytosolic arginine sensor for mTORC1 subunit 2